MFRRVGYGELTGFQVAGWVILCLLVGVPTASTTATVVLTRHTAQKRVFHAGEPPEHGVG